MRIAATALLLLALAAFAPQPPDEESRPHASVTEERRPSSDIAGIISRQLIMRGCWTDHSDMPEAPRLRVTIRIWLGSDGYFSAPPQVIDPALEPLNDKQMQLFLNHARRALNVCNRLGWQLPEGSSELLKDNFIDIMFMAKIGRDS